jgi:hypothetical protein
MQICSRFSLLESRVDGRINRPEWYSSKNTFLHVFPIIVIINYYFHRQ